jgi:hypothetical protein
MALKFNNQWRSQSPADGRFINRELPPGAVNDLLALASKVATQGNRKQVLEHFKSFTAHVSGRTHTSSSDVGWAESDLASNVKYGAENAPLLIEAFYDACNSLIQQNPDWWLPDEGYLNTILRKHNVGYEIRFPDLLALESGVPPVPLPEVPPPSVEEAAVEVYQNSVARAEQLLAEGRPREAVQELLWLLETVATAFRGIETESGTVAGKYFNQIAKDLKGKVSGTTLERVLDWVTTLHGYLSSPSGGGVRHGLDLNSGVQPTMNDGRMYCNLIRSYIGYLLGEHERLSATPGRSR